MKFRNQVNPTETTLKLLLCLFTLSGLLTGAAQGKERERGPFPSIQLPGKLHGEAAIKALGARLPEIAAWYGHDAQEFKNILKRDRSLWADKNGRLSYECDELAPADLTFVIVPTQTVDNTPLPFPIAQTFRLHSTPGSTKTIYLDFNGHLLSGTAWNQNYTGGQPVQLAPFDLDGNPATFSTNECRIIQQAWLRVTEDFAPFDIDVTTEPPAESALTRSLASDEQYGIRMVITPTAFMGGTAGRAYVGSFNQVGDYYKPGFCFAVGTSFTEKNVAEICSHEVGHTLGLSHDGTTLGEEYYNGHGNWGPIMGGNGNEITQWSKGEYANANNKEDDLAVIQAHGVNYYPDTSGKSPATAIQLAGPAINTSDVFERSTDVDYYAICTGTGSIKLNIQPAARGPNLDIQASLYDAAGNAVAANNPTGLTASINAAVTAGTYYLAIKGTGTGDPITGYSSYASLGQYTITGTVSAAVSSQPPIAIAQANLTAAPAGSGIQFSAAESGDPDGSITAYAWNFGDGTTSSQINPLHVYPTAGTYTAWLTVTDNTGLSDVDSITVTITPVTRILHIDRIDMALYTSRKNYGARATVVVKDATGSPCQGAVVSGTWSGLVTGTGIGTTGTAGSTVLSSPVTAASGTFIFTVTSITANGCVYNAAGNIETGDSIIRTISTRK
jgi:PKD repeat protein